MRNEALFLNGVYKDVLRDILAVQAHLPEQIMYLQPHSGQRIVHLAENPPTVGDPVRLFASLTSDLATVHYVGEIVGWDDKRILEEDKLHVLNRLIYLLQPTEGGVYKKAKPGGSDCVNLLYVRRLRELSKPFSVAELIKVDTGEPVSTQRTTSGGWAYVANSSDAWLEARL